MNTEKAVGVSFFARTRSLENAQRESKRKSYDNHRLKDEFIGPMWRPIESKQD